MVTIVMMITRRNENCDDRDNEDSRNDCGSNDDGGVYNQIYHKGDGGDDDDDNDDNDDDNDNGDDRNEDNDDDVGLE